jgi:hypothetical protein
MDHGRYFSEKRRFSPYAVFFSVKLTSAEGGGRRIILEN